MDATSWTRRAAACTGKAAFATPQLAAKVKRRRARRNKDMREQQVYRCPCCGLFHIGTPRKSLHAPTQRASQGDGQDML